MSPARKIKKARKPAAVDWESRARTRLRRVLQALGSRRKLSVEVSVVGDAAMTKINGQYRGKRKPTDVLSFPAPKFFQSTGILGELVLCIPQLKRQARELGHEPERELDVLLVHGVLHLQGYDHELGRHEAARMAKRERQVLRRLWGCTAAEFKKLPRGLIERNGGQ